MPITMSVRIRWTPIAVAVLVFLPIFAHEQLTLVQRGPDAFDPAQSALAQPT